MTGDSIGRVVGVHGFHVRVELHSEQRSAVRASIDGVETQIKINAYITFEIGSGESVLGIVTDLDAREVFEPDDEELTLELTRPRRLASVQLLGTVKLLGEQTDRKYQFDPGVNILPTLDTLAIPARREILSSVLTHAPRRNESDDVPDSPSGKAEDTGLLIGQATAAPDKEVVASFNDLFSRPLAIVGNTGSGKSCSIAHLLQQTRKKVPVSENSPRPRVFILDINGEYSSAFKLPEPENGRQPNKIYVNGIEFCVPLWLMNAHEVCQWLSAAEQVQEPTLKQFWSSAKGSKESSAHRNLMMLSLAMQAAESLIGILGNFGVQYRGQKIRNAGNVVSTCLAELQGEEEYVVALAEQGGSFENIINDTVEDEFNTDPTKEPGLREAASSILERASSVVGGQAEVLIESADKPKSIALSLLRDPKKLLQASQVEGSESPFGQMLRGLQLRLGNRLSDKRWYCFRSYEELGVEDVGAWFKRIGIGEDSASDIQIIDCSMLSFEVLPFVCAIIARMLLEVREYVPANKRFNDPWVLVLEEAHNYVRPRREGEGRGIGVSRETFERIAKEGRKFGLSLVVASQRPSDISQTVLSQCANFLIHRLQNPDDIEHFRKIVPSQSRRLMDQITVLRAGEGIIVGSAVHIPSRVQVVRPDPEPSSQSSSPFTFWREDAPAFDIGGALSNWVDEE